MFGVFFQPPWETQKTNSSWGGDKTPGKSSASGCHYMSLVTFLLGWFFFGSQLLNLHDKASGKGLGVSKPRYV